MTKKLLGGLLSVLIAALAHGSAPLEAADVWVNATGNLARKLSECGTLTLLSSVPGSDTIIAGVAGRGLWANRSGNTWVRLGDGPGSGSIMNRASWIVHDPANPGVFWESGIYGEDGINKTTDHGSTFRRLGDITHNDYVSVDFSDPARRTLLAGGHEAGQTVYLSVDGGQTWTNVGANLPAGTRFSSHPFILNSQTYIVNASGIASSGTPGIYRTTNGGASWQRVSALAPAGSPLRASNGIIYWSANGGVLRSVDSGSTWSHVGSNLKPVTPVELPDGRLVSASETRLMISADGGATWAPIGATLPYVPDGLVYSPQRKAFFIWRGDCRDEVPLNAVLRLDLDVSSDAPRTPSP